MYIPLQRSVPPRSASEHMDDQCQEEKASVPRGHPTILAMLSFSMFAMVLQSFVLLLPGVQKMNKHAVSKHASQ